MKVIEAFNVYINWRHQNRRSKTVGADFMHLSDFIFYLRDVEREVESITLNECERWLLIVRSLGYDDNTVVKKALAIKMWFENLIKREVSICFNPELIPIPRKTFKFPRVATEENYQKLLSSIPDQGKYRPCYWHVRNKAMIMMMHDTGARNGEIVSLDMDDIDLERMAARVKTEKSRGTVPYREIFWNGEANEQLKKWLEARKKLAEEVGLEEPSALFVGIKGGHRNCPGKGRRLQVNFVSEILRKYSNKAGLEQPLNPHSLRHLFTRDLGRKGADVFYLSSLLGHKRVESTYPYAMLFGKDREDAYRKFRGK